MKKLLLFLVLGLTVAPLAAEQGSALPTEQRTVILQDLNAGLVSQIQKGILLLEGVGTLSEHGNFAKADKQKLRQWIEHNRTLLKTLKEQAHHIDEAAIARTSKILNNLLQSIQITIAGGLKRMDCRPLDEFRPRAVSSTPEAMIETFQKNTQTLATIEQNISTASVTITNRIARAVDPILFNKYTGYAVKAAIGCAGLALAYHLVNLPIDEKTTADGVRDVPVWEGVQEAIFSAKTLGAALAKTGQGFVENQAAVALGTALALGTKTYSFAQNCGRQLRDKLKGVHQVEKSIEAQIIDDLTLDSPELIGLESQCEQLRRVVEHLRNPERALAAGTEPSKGILLTGPSRTGKTMLAKALAGTINKMYAESNSGKKIDFWEIPGNIFNRATVKAVIEDAKKNAPSIIFIDELHSLRLQASTDAAQLAEFLTQMDSLKSKDPNKQVFLIAATNRPDLLDPALLSADRFSLVIPFELPGETERHKYFTTMLEKEYVDLSTVDIDSLVKQTAKCSYGRLGQIVQDARCSANNAGESLAHYHLQHSVDALVHRILPHGPSHQEETNLIAAYMAGRTLIHKLLDVQAPIELVTIRGVKPKIQEEVLWQLSGKGHQAAARDAHKATYGRFKAYAAGSLSGVIPMKEKEKICKALLAGLCAQEILYGTQVPEYRSKDLKKALQLAQELVLKGIPLDALSKQRQDQVRDEAEKLLLTYQQEVTLLLKANCAKLESVYAGLKEREILRSYDIQELCTIS